MKPVFLCLLLATSALAAPQATQGRFLNLQNTFFFQRACKPSGRPFSGLFPCPTGQTCQAGLINGLGGKVGGFVCATGRALDANCEATDQCLAAAPFCVIAAATTDSQKTCEVCTAFGLAGQTSAATNGCVTGWYCDATNTCVAQLAAGGACAAPLGNFACLSGTCTADVCV